MILDINYLISFFEKNSNKNFNSELGEQESGSSSAGGNVPKWADTIGGPKRSKANMLGKKGEKWQSGLTRGVANQIW